MSTEPPPRSTTDWTKFRFTSPVKVGSRIRIQATITELTQAKGGAQIKVNATIEI
jgi:acyl dehydratase